MIIVITSKSDPDIKLFFVYVHFKKNFCPNCKYKHHISHSGYIEVMKKKRIFLNLVENAHYSIESKNDL